jgi:hypothetical protein
MSEERGAGGLQAGEVSDADLLTIIRRPDVYSAEVSDAARLEAQLRGLIGQFEDAEYLVATPHGRAQLDVVALKDMYLDGMIRREAPVYVASRGQWLPLTQVFDINRWEMTHAAEADAESDARFNPPRQSPRRPSQTATRDRSPNTGGMGYNMPHGPNMQMPPLAPNATAQPPVLSASVPPYLSSASFNPANTLQPSGVGGWLLLFIIGQLACKPVNTCAQLGQSASYPMFPLTNFVVSLEFLMSLGMLLFGIVVSLGLLRSTDEGAVRLTKTYLLTQLGVAVFDLFLVCITDAPAHLKDAFIARAFSSAITTGIYVLIWYQYFKRSKRVEATYFNDEESPPAGGGLTTIRLN